ncbi:MAG: hypothetical protein DSY38_03685 [Fusobacteria bacterium]|nr:MAG: hypothetical protein DSY38_03685 [Fusobacteriota bacterium]
MAVFIWLSVKYRFLKSKSFIIPFLVALIILSFFLRWQVSYPHKDDAIFGFVQTHLRADGISFAQNYLPLRLFKSDETIISFLGRMNYSLMSKYLFTVSFREDGASKFNEENR